MIAESSLAAEAGVAQAEALEVATDLFIGSDTAARLVLLGSESVSAERLELVAKRLGSIVGLAYAQHYRPSAVQAANTSLLQAIAIGADGLFAADLARQAQIGSDGPVMMLVFQSYDMARIRASCTWRCPQSAPSWRAGGSRRCSRSPRVIRAGPGGKRSPACTAAWRDCRLNAAPALRPRGSGARSGPWPRHWSWNHFPSPPWTRAGCAMRRTMRWRGWRRSSGTGRIWIISLQSSWGTCCSTRTSAATCGWPRCWCGWMPDAIRRMQPISSIWSARRCISAWRGSSRCSAATCMKAAGCCGCIWPAGWPWAGRNTCARRV